MDPKSKCPNMNHGRSQVSIRHCTDCGALLNSSVRNPCNEEIHASRRKNRSKFCHDCGKSLNAAGPNKR